VHRTGGVSGSGGAVPASRGVEPLATANRWCWRAWLRTRFRRRRRPGVTCARRCRDRWHPRTGTLARLYLGLIAEDSAPPITERRSGTRATPTMSSPAPGPSRSPTTAGGGYDSNARQTAPGSLDADGATLVPQQAAVYGAASVELALGRRFDGGGSFDASYAIEQSAYENRAFRRSRLSGARAGAGVRPSAGGRDPGGADCDRRPVVHGVGTELRAFQRSLRLDPQLVLGTSHGARSASGRPGSRSALWTRRTASSRAAGWRRA
jgi:hypothetical protein